MQSRLGRALGFATGPATSLPTLRLDGTSIQYYPGKEVGQAFQPDKAQSQAGKPDLQCVSFVPG